jgi:5-methylcytosine-specific restriction endonuclease McrA
VPAWVGLLALLEDYVITWDDPRAAGRRSAEATYRRDGWRCAAPGCTSRSHLEEHHVHYRSRGGDNAASNRICLCRFHHQRGEHGGLASCRGRAPLDVLWRLGRRTLATWFRNERRVEAPA